MRYVYDTEFIEDGRSVELISIGIVREDGLEYYAVNRDAPWKRIAKHQWLVENVVDKLPRVYGDARNFIGRRNPLALDFQHPSMRDRRVIANEVCDFLQAGGSEIELWADYGAYDHVVLMWLWGPMVHKPEGLPYYTKDLRQEIDHLGKPELPEQVDGAHDALADARHGMVIARHIGVI